MKYPKETKGSKIARKVREKCNKLTDEERLYYYNKGYEIIFKSK